MKPWSIKDRVALAVALLFVVVLVIASTVQMRLLQADFARIVAQEQVTLVEGAAREIDDKFETGSNALSATASFIDERDLSAPAQMRKQFAERPSLMALFDDLLVLDADGRIITDYPELAGRVGVDASDREYFKEVVRTGKTVISEPALGKTRKEPIVQIATPIVARDGHLAGVLIGVIRLFRSSFLGALGEQRIGQTGYFVLLTRGSKPLYVVHPDKTRILKERPANGSQAVADAIDGFEGTAEGISSLGVTTIYTSKRQKSVPWVLIAAVPKDEVFAPLQAAQRRLWIIAAITAVVIVPLLWLTVRWLLAPLQMLRVAMMGMREGEGGFVPIPGERGDEVGSIIRQFNQLMSQREAAEKARRDSEARLRLLADNIPALISYVDADLRIELANSCYRDWFGLDPAAIIGRRVDEIFPDPGYRESMVPELERALKGQPATLEREIQTRGGMRFVRTTLFPHWNKLGEVVGIFHMSTDITSDRKLHEELDRLARRDPLTGLHNRRSFMEVLPQALSRGRRQERWLALLFVDLDGFKAINDAHGHGAGDEVLCAVAERLEASVRVSDTVARLGGDEFTVLLEGLASPEEADAVAAKIITAIGQPIQGQWNYRISASVGVAACLAGAAEPEELLKRADDAAYVAKNAGRGRYQVAEPLSA